VNSRDLVLARIRAGLADVPDGEAPGDVPVPRDYLDVPTRRTPAQRTELLAGHLAEYRAHVHRTDEAGLPAAIAALLTAHGTRTVVVPAGLPSRWLGALDPSVGLITDDHGQSAAELDAVDSVVTGCALAVAETGTLVLDGGAGQGRRRITLVPDHHVCVVRAPGQIVDSVPQALSRLDAGRPLTWISGPSATSDIELNRIEGVHGPRTLDVVIVAR
jgi:L-lactate dehydrogenase complex protein LldG